MDIRLKEEIRQLVLDLVAQRYGALAADGRCGRLTEGELEAAISGYGRTLVPLPDEAWPLVEVYSSDANSNSCSLDVPLWTAEEGRSDLTLSLRAMNKGDRYKLEIDDLHVL